MPCCWRGFSLHSRKRPSTRASGKNGWAQIRNLSASCCQSASSRWIERNVLLILKDAPFDWENPQLVPAAGSCLDCPKRTGHNKLLFAGISENSDACSDPGCYSAKLDAHVKMTIAAKPKLIQITTAYGKAAESSPILQR